MLCVTSAQYHISIHCSLVDTIRPSRGLRQGDLLSPYLFIICAKSIFFSLLQNSENVRLLHGSKVSRNGPRVSHLFLQWQLSIFLKLLLVNVMLLNTSFLLMSKFLVKPSIFKISVSFLVLMLLRNCGILFRISCLCLCYYFMDPILVFLLL